MKKTFLTCLAVVALFAIATSASAITCTIDQRPAATLLVPYFAVSFNADGTPLGTGTSARDTIVTIGNASAAPMIAHVSVFNERTVLVLDFNVALTGFDLQAMSMAQILSGNLPSTGWVDSKGRNRDACQRDPFGVFTYPSVVGFIRIFPPSPTVPEDNTLATTRYPSPAFAIGSSFEFQVIDSLDSTSDSLGCGTGAVDGVISGLIHGYVTIDHVNYCNLSNPSDPLYYLRDAIGNENNLFGEVIFTSGSGIPTMGLSTVNIEADPSLQAQGVQSDTTPLRTFYRRYWSVTGPPAETFCTNCVGSCVLFFDVNLLCNAPWDAGYGDEREPLGLKYAVRYFEGGGITTNFRVWRASSGNRTDLTGPISSSTFLPTCTRQEPTVTLVFFDEDENTVTQGVCPSPCTQPSFNFPLETQRTPAANFSRPLGAVAGWVSMSFVNTSVSGNNGGKLDQAWVETEMVGPAAFITASYPGTQLDGGANVANGFPASTCNPLGISGIVVPTPVIPTIAVGTGP